MITNETIQRFFLQRCSAEEAEAVVKYFDENPEVLIQYMNGDEWEQFQSLQEPAEERSTLLWDRIQQQKQKIETLVSYLKWAAVAASVILIIGLGWLWTQNKTTLGTAKTERKPIQKLLVNNSKDTMPVYLSDGSLVDLSPGSSLSYPDTFVMGKRNITLYGEAYFEIAKDKNKPFTVYSDALATTVLGTHFSVKSFEDESTIKVSLFEGKVMVSGADAINKKRKENIYLSPGETLVYNKQSMLASITKTANNTNSNNSKIKDKKSGAGTVGENWYMFNDQAMSEVFDQLEKIYNQKIIYSKDDVKGLTFIGKIDKPDSLSHILNSIALLNDLKVTRNANGDYVIKK